MSQSGRFHEKRDLGGKPKSLLLLRWCRRGDSTDEAPAFSPSPSRPAPPPDAPLKSGLSSLFGRRRARVRVPAEHNETIKERWISPSLPGRFMVPKGGLEPPRVSPPPSR